MKNYAFALAVLLGAAQAATQSQISGTPKSAYKIGKLPFALKWRATAASQPVICLLTH